MLPGEGSAFSSLSKACVTIPGLHSNSSSLKRGLLLYLAGGKEKSHTVVLDLSVNKCMGQVCPGSEFLYSRGNWSSSAGKKENSTWNTEFQKNMFL